MSNLISYIIGYALSLLLTFLAVGAYGLHQLNQHTSPSHELLAVIFVILAVAQLLVQLFFFLHLGRRDSHSNAVAFGFAAFVLVVFVGGTLWIMQNLRHNMHQTKTTFEPGHVDPAHEN
jgi:cytochrome o ubiquinol oxidase subunit IV